MVSSMHWDIGDEGKIIISMDQDTLEKCLSSGLINDREIRLMEAYYTASVITFCKKMFEKQAREMKKEIELNPMFCEFCVYFCAKKSNFLISSSWSFWGPEVWCFEDVWDRLGFDKDYRIIATDDEGVNYFDSRLTPNLIEHQLADYEWEKIKGYLEKTGGLDGRTVSDRKTNKG